LIKKEVATAPAYTRAPIILSSSTAYPMTTLITIGAITAKMRRTPSSSLRKA